MNKAYFYIFALIITIGNITGTFADENKATEYLIAPGDLLDIAVWKEPELTRDVTVRPDGGITFPLIGNIAASGKTADQLREEIAASLSKFMPDPAVSVTIKQFKGNVIYVIGKVAKPGEYAVGRYIDVMQAISLAGGLTVYADEDDIKVLRRTKTGTVTFNFDYDEVVKGENLEQNIILHPGDTVMVPE